MPYNINYSDTDKTHIVVEDNIINVVTSLGFPGNNTPGYGQVIAENFLHLLENFANNAPPSKPVEGQLWYDNSNDVNQLRLYDGTQWVSASGLKKSLVQPTNSSSSAGDLWVNLDSQQLYLYTGNSWILVGPEFSSGLFTGVKAETLISTENQSYTVFSLRISNQIIAIYSLNQFVPKTAISGFKTIEAGLNLASNYKIYGTSEKAENLVIGGSVVAANNFLRSDQISTTSNQLKVLSDQGIVVGANSQTLLKVDNNSTVIQNSVSGATFDIKMKNTTNISPVTVLRIKSSGEVGIGSNDVDVTEKLTVFGNIKLSPNPLETTTTGRLIIDNTNESENIDTGSIVTDGGIGLAKSIHVGENAVINGTVFSGNILPISANKDIGSASNRYNEIHANKFYGSLEGNVTGSITGRSGFADRLTNARTFSLAGDVESNSVAFDGQNDVSFSVRLKNTLISDRTVTTTANNLDEILINRKDASGAEIGLFKITKRNFIKSIPVMPVGMIAPYAGREAPQGWLLCDGSEVKKSEFPELWDIIKYSYKPEYDLSDQGLQMFGLPDLRGRFPLGLDNMGGPNAGRIQNNFATQVGNSGGNETVIIEKSNLPEHNHTLTGNSGNQYYAVRAGADTPVDDNAISLSIDSGSGGTQGIPTSGNIRTDQPLSRPLDVLNPYLAINYIIYTGR